MTSFWSHTAQPIHGINPIMCCNKSKLLPVNNCFVAYVGFEILKWPLHNKRLFCTITNECSYQILEPTTTLKPMCKK